MRAILSTMMLILVSVPAMAAQQAMIVVRPECTVSGAICTIGDMGMVQGADTCTTQRVKALTVCSTPLPGKSRKVQRQQIVIALRGGSMADGTYQLLCPPEVIVTRDQFTVTGQTLFDAAKSFAETSVSWPGTTVIEPMRLPMDQQVPAGKLETRVKAGTRSVRKGQNSISVEIVVNGQLYRTAQVTVNVKVLAQVLVATQAIKRSDAVSGANTTVEQRDVTRLPDDVLPEAPASDSIACMPIPQGAVIRGQWVSAPPVVKAGDSVMVIVESEGVRVADKGTAAQDGRPGDRIKVRLSGDAREIRATVAEPGVVKISLGRRTN
jgi:flagella basal body P-ring formation protein FlgA